jgi:hypothetical protein
MFNKETMIVGVSGLNVHAQHEGFHQASKVG